MMLIMRSSVYLISKKLDVTVTSFSSARNSIIWFQSVLFALQFCKPEDQLYLSFSKFNLKQNDCKNTYRWKRAFHIKVTKV